MAPRRCVREFVARAVGLLAESPLDVCQACSARCAANDFSTRVDRDAVDIDVEMKQWRCGKRSCPPSCFVACRGNEPIKYGLAVTCQAFCGVDSGHVQRPPFCESKVITDDRVAVRLVVERPEFLREPIPTEASRHRDVRNWTANVEREIERRQL